MASMFDSLINNKASSSTATNYSQLLQNQANTTAGSQNRAAIADNFQNFLQLLLTQLKHQNPMEPLNADKLTGELVQFSQVEQQLRSNDSLDKLVALSKSASASNVVGYLGQQIVAEGTNSQLTNGKAEWMLTAPKESKNATVTVKNGSGDVVYTRKMNLNSGANSFQWDGINNSGAKSVSGTFSVSVEAVDVQGNKLTVSTDARGKVDGIDLTGDEPMLSVGGLRIPLSKVRSVSANAAS